MPPDLHVTHAGWRGEDEGGRQKLRQGRLPPGLAPPSSSRPAACCVPLTRLCSPLPLRPCRLGGNPTTKNHDYWSFNIFPIRSYLSLLPQVSHGGAGVHPHGSVVQAQHLKQARDGVHGSNIINKVYCCCIPHFVSMSIRCCFSKKN